MGTRKATIKRIEFDHRERPYRALIRTRYGLVRVRWRTFGRKRLWFVSGSLDAQYEAALPIEYINMLFEG